METRSDVYLSLARHHHNTTHHGHDRPRRADRAVVLPFCVDNEAAHLTLANVCPRIQGQANALCLGLLQMQNATCEQLGSEAFLRSMVEQVGLTPDSRGAAIYGRNASSHIVQVHGKSARHKVGLWQSPEQLAAALIYLGSRANVRRYIEVGVYTAWTCSFVSTYLRRVGRLGAFRGVAVDLVNTAIAHGTRDLLPRLNVTFLFRRQVVLPVPEAERFDFCFVDGDHSYVGVRRDYATFAPSCTYMMFHDIQDVSTLHLGNFSGGVPMFWAHLVAHAGSAPSGRPRTHEFTHVPRDKPEGAVPSFGLGIIGPNERGTCEPKTPESEWTRWDTGDASIETMHNELCRLNRTRLCSLGMRRIGEANGIFAVGGAKPQRPGFRLHTNG